MTAAVIHRIRTSELLCSGTVSYDEYREGFAPEAVELPCGFLGEVTVEIDAVTLEQKFTCPSCGHVNVGPVDADLLHEVAPVVVVAEYGTVRNVLMRRPGVWLTAEQVHALIPTVLRDQLPVTVIRAQFGSLHDHGQVTRAGHMARWDA